MPFASVYSWPLLQHPNLFEASSRNVCDGDMEYYKGHTDPQGNVVLPDIGMRDPPFFCLKDMWSY